MLNIMIQSFQKISQIKIPPRPKWMKIVYHLYVVFAEKKRSTS